MAAPVADTQPVPAAVPGRAPDPDPGLVKIELRGDCKVDGKPRKQGETLWVTRAAADACRAAGLIVQRKY